MYQKDNLDTMEELRRENEQLKKALKAAEETNQAKTSFLSSMSHDIRTPMNAIVGMTTIALNHIDEKARVQDCLSKIKTASDHLMSLINDVLDMSRIDSGRTTLSEERFSLADLVHDLMVLLRPLAAAREQNMAFDVSGIRHEALLGDVLYLRQVFVNIISNAIKYTDRGGSIQVRFSEEALPGPKRIRLCFSCRDNGIGMSEEFVRVIFKPFTRDSGSTVARTEGTGLGMSIAHSLVKKMDGDIRVESELGKGSTFFVELPLSVSDAVEVSRSLNGKPILVVGAGEEQMEIIARSVREAGGEAVRCGSGVDAVGWIAQAQFEGRPPEAILLDGHMGENVAMDLAGYLRGQLDRKTPIILFSEGDWGKIEYSARRAGITGFVPCPLFKGRLLEALTGDGKAEEAQAVENNFAGMRILLAEDNELNMEIAREMIGETGAQVDTAVNGLEAFNAFAASEEGYYDLVLMDVQMPVMDGYEAVRRLRPLPRADAKTVCIAAMTANAFVEDIKRTRAAGMNEHLSKPVDVKSLEEVMRRCFRGE